jgi:hypothetical protein
MKTLLGIAIGVVLAVAVIVPVTKNQTAAQLEAQRVQLKLEAAEAELAKLEALKNAQTAVKAEIPAEPQETEASETLAAEPLKASKSNETTAGTTQAAPVKGTTAEVKPSIGTEPSVGTEPSAGSEPAQVKPETTPKPPEPTEKTEKTEAKQSSPVQVKTAEYPKEFYIDGQKYAYLTAYAEENLNASPLFARFSDAACDE